MVSEIFGFDGLILVVVTLVGVAVPLWAIIDALIRPAAAFRAAGSSKALWVTLVLVLWLLTGVLGLLLAVVYLAAIRPRVRAATPSY
jgi:hypothetical protein